MMQLTFQWQKKHIDFGKIQLYDNIPPTIISLLPYKVQAYLTAHVHAALSKGTD